MGGAGRPKAKGSSRRDGMLDLGARFHASAPTGGDGNSRAPPTTPPAFFILRRKTLDLSRCRGGSSQTTTTIIQPPPHSCWEEAPNILCPERKTLDHLGVKKVPP